MARTGQRPTRARWVTSFALRAAAAAPSVPVGIDRVHDARPTGQSAPGDWRVGDVFGGITD